MAPLEAERRPARTRDLCAAGAPAAVRRKDRNVVSEREQPITEGVVGRARELFRELRTEQVDAGDLSNEERTA